MCAVGEGDARCAVARQQVRRLQRPLRGLLSSLPYLGVSDGPQQVSGLSACRVRLFYKGYTCVPAQLRLPSFAKQATHC